jgi:hypothetical protein
LIFLFALNSRAFYSNNKILFEKNLQQLRAESLEISSCDLLSKDIEKAIENAVCSRRSGTEGRTRVQIYGNRALEILSGLTEQEVTRGWRKLSKYELLKL